MSKQKGYSLRQAESKIGLKKSQISNLIKQGKIKTLANGRIDPDSIKNYFENYKQSSQKIVQPSIEVDKNKLDDFKEEKEEIFNRVSFAEAQTMKENYLAALRKLEYEEKKGKLLDKDEVKKAGQEVMIKVRQKLLSIPVKAAPQIQTLKTPAEIQDLLSNFINEALAELCAVENVYRGDKE